MTKKEFFTIMILEKSRKWLNLNPLLLDNQEKKKFQEDLMEYIENPNTSITDEVYDFMVQTGMVNNPSRQSEMFHYLNKKYVLKNKKILEVGAGRTCVLAQALAEYGAKMTAIDPKIRLKPMMLAKQGVIAKKTNFYSDEFAPKGKGTNIDEFDLVIGMEPCDATEHIIRQCIKFNKPFDILLCGAPHKGLNGQTFDSYQEWYEYLKTISKQVEIEKFESSYFAYNSEAEELEP